MLKNGWKLIKISRKPLDVHRKFSKDLTKIAISVQIDLKSRKLYKNLVKFELKHEK